MATPNIVPRADNEGSLGVSTKQWADIQAKKFNGKAQASTNTANTVVIRDASGNFSAGTITATLTGNVTGDVTGNVTGNVTGSSGSCTGNAATATKLATTRALTIGSTAKNFDGSAAVTWSLSEIGAAASSHTHSYLPLSGGTMTGVLYPQRNTSYTTGQARRIILSTGNPSGGGNGDIWIKYIA